METGIRYEVLGTVRAWRGAEEVDLGPGKRRAVLVALLLGGGEPVSTERIIDAVWGEEPPSTGSNVVQKHVSGLRSALAGHALPYGDAGYTLAVGPGSLDLHVFLDHVGTARQLRAAGRAAEAAAALRAGLGLWRGPALAGLPGAYFAAERDRLHELRVAAHEEAIELDVDLGRHAEAIPELIGLIAEHPLREGLRALLMLALARSGRPAEALQAFRQARAHLSEELGVEPGERLQQLHRQILAAEHPPAPRPAPASTPAPADPIAAAPGPAVRQPAYVRLGYVAAMVVVPLVTFGFCTWAVMAYAAVRLRGRWTGAAAAGYLILVVIMMLLARDQATADRNAFMLVLGMTVCMPGGALHGSLLIGRLARARTLSADPLVALAAHRRALRRQAVEILREDPRLAVELRIGRPDLPRQFDDGGLVDVNTVPEGILAELPQVTAHQARSIVQARSAGGPFAGVDELAARGLLPAPVVESLRDTLIALR